MTQIANTHRVGWKSKPFLLGTDFAGLIFTGELSGVDSAGVLRQGVAEVSSVKRIKTIARPQQSRRKTNTTVVPDGLSIENTMVVAKKE